MATYFIFKDHIYKLYVKVVYSILKLCIGFNICLKKSVSNLRTNKKYEVMNRSSRFNFESVW